jgi:hypothetical protein
VWRFKEITVYGDVPISQCIMPNQSSRKASQALWRRVRELVDRGYRLSFNERLANRPDTSLYRNKDMSITSQYRAVPHRFRGRLLLLLGLSLAVLGVVAYVVQISLQRLVTPWYMPALASLGVVFVVMSLFERRTIWRILALLAVVLLTGLELAFLVAMRLPPYTGPVAVGRPFPAFETSRADGTPFTQRDLAGDQNNVLVFFRGRW